MMRPSVAAQESAMRPFFWYGFMLRFSQMTSSTATSRNRELIRRGAWWFRHLDGDRRRRQSRVCGGQRSRRLTEQTCALPSGCGRG